MMKLSRYSLGNEELQAIQDVFNDGYLGMGKFVMQFEKELETFFSNKTNVVAVNTGTSALHLAIQACGIGTGDEVLIPSITYVASFQATSATGAIVIACDVDLSTGCICVKDAESRITKNTKAIMHVHYAGNLGNRDAIFALAQKYNLRVIEDAAHSFGSTNGTERVGETGDITCFSFDGIKNITCGEGGAVVSTDKELINKIKDLRLLGVEKDTENRFKGKRSWDFDVKEQGWRYHMSNINAAIGLTQLKKINSFSNARRTLAKAYAAGLQNSPVQLLNINLDHVVSHIYPIIVPNNQRNALREFLMERNIETGIHYKPNHLLTKYAATNCPNADFLGESLLSLPIHVGLTEDDIVKVCKSIGEFYA